MKTETFKSMLRGNKEVLKGKTLTIFFGKTDMNETFTTLKEFGLRILELEKSGYTFRFEDSLTIVRASYNNPNYRPATIVEMTAEIECFGTAA